MVAWHFSLIVLAAEAVHAGVAASHPDPRDIVEKAIQAMGGAEALQKASAVRIRYRLGSGSAESYFEQRGQLDRYRYAVNDHLQLHNGRKAWAGRGGELWERKDRSFEYAQCEAFVERLQMVSPLRDAKVYRLSWLGEVRDKEVVLLGIKVSATGKPDIKLYFDKSTALLVRVSFPAFGNNTEYRLEDYEAVTAEDERRLSAAGRSLEGGDLVASLRRNIPAAADRKAMEALIEPLGDRTYAARHKASAALSHYGLKAMAILRQAPPSGDLERDQRIRKCLEQLEREAGLAAATVRLIAGRRPAGAMEVLLDFLACAPTEDIARNVEDAVLSWADGDAHLPALLFALGSDHARVRQAAAAALAAHLGVSDRAGRRIYPCGLRLPRRCVVYSGGGGRSTYEIVSREFFNRFDDALFEPKKAPRGD